MPYGATKWIFLRPRGAVERCSDVAIEFEDTQYWRERSRQLEKELDKLRWMLQTNIAETTYPPCPVEWDDTFPEFTLQWEYLEGLYKELANE